MYISTWRSTTEYAGEVSFHWTVNIIAMIDPSSGLCLLSLYISGLIVECMWWWTLDSLPLWHPAAFVGDQTLSPPTSIFDRLLTALSLSISSRCFLWGKSVFWTNPLHAVLAAIHTDKWEQGERRSKRRELGMRGSPLQIWRQAGKMWVEKVTLIASDIGPMSKLLWGKIPSLDVLTLSNPPCLRAQRLVRNYQQTYVTFVNQIKVNDNFKSVC